MLSTFELNTHMLHSLFELLQAHKCCVCAMCVEFLVPSTVFMTASSSQKHTAWSWLQYEECNWGVVADLLPQLPKVTGLVVLQHTLLQAALCFLGSSAANPSSTPMGLAVRQVPSPPPPPRPFHVLGLVRVHLCKPLTRDSAESIATV